ncbi:hypothetical protein [Maritalea mediterranea]|uniref:Uncharacterized protein n=1 Tax=Maritalea mediterranea TaxID=2909667 RepID=A0ABS9E7Y2_9HYPH|nr:hypothetical protein [Maritalea mediterranea]MCF4098995.1 hypothetical protein [Maritalea mediterranea]
MQTVLCAVSPKAPAFMLDPFTVADFNSVITIVRRDAPDDIVVTPLYPRKQIGQRERKAEREH